MYSYRIAHKYLRNSLALVTKTQNIKKLPTVLGNRYFSRDISKLSCVRTTIATCRQSPGMETASIPSDTPEEVAAGPAQPSQASEEHIPKPESTPAQSNDGNDAEGPKLSRRAMKRLMREKRRQGSKHPAKRQRRNGDDKEREINFSEASLKDTEYYFENGLRKVYPYNFTFKTYAKGRWVGKPMIDIFANEFKAYKLETYTKAIEAGRVTVNGAKVPLDYVFRDNDYVENVVHRHELPVVKSKLTVIEDSEHFLVVDKPSSIPIHPCGRYRHNSLTYILAIENGYRNLRTIYRLDRLTSGVFIFCKTDSKTRLLQSHIKGRKVEKSYLARVNGEFPSEPVVCSEPIDNLTMKIGLFKVGPNGKEAKTTFERISYNGSSSMVLCKPHTGRTHQIRVHLQYIGFPIVNDPLYNSHVWGPERGKGGNFGKPTEQLIEELINHHTAERFGDDELIEDLSTSEKKPDSNASVDDHDGAPQAKDNPQKEAQPDALPGDDLQSSEVPSKTDAMLGTETHVSADCNSAETSTFDPDKVTTDPMCEECKRKYVEPKQDHLVMFLHALSYKGPGWSFKTEMPHWAKDDWEPDK